MLRLRRAFASRRLCYVQHDKKKKQADPLSRVTGPRMNPSVDVGRPPRPFRHLRMAQRCSPDPSSSRAPVHSALVQISVTRHHQRGRPAFKVDARENCCAWQVEDGKKLAGRLLGRSQISGKRMGKKLKGLAISARQRLEVLWYQVIVTAFILRALENLKRRSVCRRSEDRVRVFVAMSNVRRFA